VNDADKTPLWIAPILMEDPPQSARRPVSKPKKRKQVTEEGRIGQVRVHLGMGKHTDGRLREIWIEIHKEGAETRALYHLVAQLFSIALDEGADPKRLLRALRSVIVGRLDVTDTYDGRFTSARSIPDFIAQVIAAEFPELGKEETETRASGAEEGVNP
jgi:hypothetical protein